LILNYKINILHSSYEIDIQHLINYKNSIYIQLSDKIRIE